MKGKMQKLKLRTLLKARQVGFVRRAAASPFSGTSRHQCALSGGSCRFYSAAAVAQTAAENTSDDSVKLLKIQESSDHLIDTQTSESQSQTQSSTGHLNEECKTAAESQVESTTTSGDDSDFDSESSLDELIRFVAPSNLLASDRLSRTLFDVQNVLNRTRSLMYVCWSNLGLASTDTQQYVQALMQRSTAKESALPITNTKAVSVLRNGMKAYARSVKEYSGEPAPTLSLKNPETWYPKARAIKRHIVYHYGPTNSGKTYGALERLKKSSSGVYCAPLRLLAWEVFERMGQSGIVCNLETGEEHWVKEGATHVCCTVEMSNLDKEYEVAVIDEIQLLGGCPQRGGAWTNALLGICAKEIHVCGDESVLELVKKLAARCGDTVELHEYKRLCDLEMDRPLASYSQVQKGDCIVAFNRGDLFRIKNEVEMNSHFKCALVYGRLPPSNRRTQAKLFNREFAIGGTNDDGDDIISAASGQRKKAEKQQKTAKYDVLVASNAIGMGLNLNIRRVVFSATKKWNGYSQAPLDTSEVLQVGGRAGRFGMFDRGYVTAFAGRDYGHVKRHMALRPPLRSKAFLRPMETHVCMVAARYPWLKFADVLRCFENRERALVEDEFSVPDLGSMIKIADMLADVPLSAKDLYIFSTVPTRSTELEVMAHVQNWALTVASDKMVNLDVDESVLKYASNPQFAESLYSLLSVYNYLRWRFPMFVDGEKCDRLLAKTAQLIQDGFDRITIDNKRHWLDTNTVPHF